ncbi:MAG: iron transporter, partial [Alphaproteobacteria bacterium RIFCSPHIGHO2_12_FULL_45_9]
MFIQTEATPNPQTLKFLPGCVVMAQGVAEFRTPEEAAAKSPLAVRLFEVDGVKGVFYGADFISITKADIVDWSDIKTYILGILFEQFSMNKPLMNDTADDDVSGDEDSETVKKIKSILDERVRPAVAKDGGDIVFHSFEKGIVFLKMRGACAGCPSSTMTLKSGIENMLRHFVPDVLEVRAVPD